MLLPPLVEHRHREDVLLCGVFSVDLAGDVAVMDGVDRIGNVDDLGQLRRDQHDAQTVFREITDVLIDTAGYLTGWLVSGIKKKNGGHL